MQRTRAFAVFAVLVVAGCFTIHISADTSVSSSVSIRLGGLGGGCYGTTNTSQDGNSATVTRTQIGSACQITSTFEATLIDSATLRQQVQDKIRDQGRDPNDVKVTLKSPLTLTIDEMQLSGIDIPSAGWSLDLAVQGQVVASLDGYSLAALPTEPIQVSLDQSAIDAVNSAYQNSTPVLVQGVLILDDLPLSSLAAIPSSTVSALSFSVLADVHAEAAVDLF